MIDETIPQDQETTPEPSLRDELEAAFDAAEEKPAESPAASEPASPEAPEPSSSERVRDEQGRFTKGPAKAKDDLGAASAAAAQPGAKPAGVTTPAGPPVPQAPPERAPQSWKPLAREHWAKLPNEVRGEVLRREREVAQTLQQTAEARQVAEQFKQMVAPFEHMMRAEGAQPLQAVANLLQTAAALRTAPPAYKAQLVANLIRGYGVPIDALDAALAGQPVPHQQQQAPTYQDPRVDQLLHRLEAQEQARTQAVQVEANTQVETFSQGKEFFGDLRHLMADVIELAAKHGERLSLDDAYARAVAMRPDISKIVQQREAAAAAANRARSTQRARVAASSVKSSSPVPQAPKSGGSLRDDIEAAFEQASNR